MDRVKKMKIEKLHAHFLITIDSYNNERVGFTVTLEEQDDIKQVVNELRVKACNAIGESAEKLDSKRRQLASECFKYEERLNKLRKEWEATADFLKAQGLNPDAPSMPQFRSLLTSVKVDSEEVFTGDDNDNF
jgi:uncharacterized coiled-coil DUF342 family protein